MMKSLPKINPFSFYGQWAGHPITDLTTIHTAALQREGSPPVIYLCGDSSLDNKAWVPSNGPGGEDLPAPVPAFYRSFLEPLNLKPDVAFHLNALLGSKGSVINAAVEASLLRQRDEKLLAHDEFVRDNIRPEDVLIVSLGANDIALSPTLSTIRHMLHLAWFTPKSSIENGTASSLQHFKTMFGTRVQSYISRITAKQKPRAVIACTIYYPLEAQASSQTSWADTQLKALGYGWYPGQLQAAIRQIHASATTKIMMEGTTVIPCALYEVLDGKTEVDYVARVEPSVKGGRKMAELLAPREYPATHGGNLGRQIIPSRSRPKAVAVADPFLITTFSGAENNQSDTGGYHSVEGDLDAEQVLLISLPTPYESINVGGLVEDAISPSRVEPLLTFINYLFTRDGPPRVISTSYGDDEQRVPESYARRVCSGFAQLGACGISVIFLSGDAEFGGRDGNCKPNGGKKQFIPHFPASCPWVTFVRAPQDFNPEVATTFFATGGGFSSIFDARIYLQSAVKAYISGLNGLHDGLCNKKGRGYPDVSAQGSATVLQWGNGILAAGGTSASASLFMTNWLLNF